MNQEEQAPIADDVLNNALGFRGYSGSIFRNALITVRALSNHGAIYIVREFPRLKNCQKERLNLGSVTINEANGPLLESEALAVQILFDECLLLSRSFGMDQERSRTLDTIFGSDDLHYDGKDNQRFSQGDVIEGIADFSDLLITVAGVRAGKQFNYYFFPDKEAGYKK